jgi:hypothetical protein
MPRPRKITVDMLLTARDRGWTTTQASLQDNFNKQSIHEACIRLGIKLDGMRSDFDAPKRLSVSAASVEKYLADQARKKAEEKAQ